MKRDAIIYCLIQGFGALFIMWLCLHLVGCASTKHVETVSSRDSTVINYRDSVVIRYRDSINLVNRHTEQTDSSQLVISFGQGGGTYNAKTGEATNVSGVQHTTTHAERQDSTAFYKSRFGALSAVTDSLQHEVSNYATTLEKERQVPKRSGYDRFCTWWFWITAILLLIKIAAWVMEKIPTTAPYVLIARKFVPFL